MALLVHQAEQLTALASPGALAVMKPDRQRWRVFYRDSDANWHRFEIGSFRLHQLGNSLFKLTR